MEAASLTRRQFLKTVGIGAAGLAMPGRMGVSNHLFGRERDKRSNIILIMADDMGYSDIGCYGGEIETPNLNKFAANGLRFTQFYNGARCCPTRASLLTGLYAHQTGIGHMTDDRGLEGYKGDLNNKCVTLAEVLKPAGYRTYMAGKWHVTKHISSKGPKYNWPCQRGFDRFYGTIIGAGSFFKPTTLVEQNTMIDVTDPDYYYTDAISNKAAGYIKEHFKSNPEKPFFMYVAYTSPHWPLHAIEKDIKKYKGRFDEGWDVLRAERQKRMIKMGLIDERWNLTERDPRVQRWQEVKNKQWQCRRMEVYAAQVDRMDQGIGRIVEALQQAGELDNTLVFFIADNGACAEQITEGWKNWIISAPVGTSKTHDGRNVQFGNDPNVLPGSEDTYQSYGVPWANVSNTPFRLYKHWVHEGGIASPLIVHWPAQIKRGGQLRRQVSHLIDVMPTFVEAAGANYPEIYKGHKILPMEGKSLVKAFDNKQIKHRAIFWEHEGNRAVRMGKWKFVARGEQRPWELYDMEADRTETNNLANKYPEHVNEMAGMYEAWAVRAKILPNKQVKSK